MKKEKKITLNEKEITITEMSVKEISIALEDIAAEGQAVMEGKKPLATIDLLFGSEASQIVICKCTGLTAEELENDYSPTDVRKLIDEVKSLNLFFFEMLAKLVKVQASLPPTK